jgi:exopolysaccharide production protein ExoZ
MILDARGFSLPQRLISIQLLRFVAALLVVHTHAVNNAVFLTGGGLILAPGQTADLGAAGVDIFFVISGFIMAATIDAGSYPTASNFIMKRVIRIVPLYFLASLPWIAIGMSRAGFDRDTLIATFLFWPVTGTGFVHPYLEVGWTLCLEMLFYAGIGLMLLLGAKRPPFGLMSIYLLFMGAAIFIDRPVLHYFGNPIIMEFLWGAGLFLALKTTLEPSQRLGTLAICTFLTAMAVYAIFGSAGAGGYMETLDGSRSATRVLLWGVPAVLLVYGMLQFEPVLRRYRYAAVLAALGEASYAIYLVHQYAAWQINSLIRNCHLAVPGDVIVAAIGAASIAAGLATYLCIERPLLARLRRRPMPEQVAAPVAPRSVA